MGMGLWIGQTFLIGILDFETEGAGRRWREGWPSKINSNWGKHCCCCWFGQKWWLSNASKRIAESFNIPKTVVLRIPKEDLCRSCVHVLFPTLWQLSEGKIDSRLARYYRDGRCRQLFLSKLLQEMSPRVIPMTPKRSDRVLIGLVRHPLGRRNWNSKGPASRPCW